mmetsp:Transcript_17395/g.52486  ORF Transcript_17395/g.52486 Transcript_17395/m.52486 type:complete len:312 (+) Transcript_17395:586-1521(+)
MVLREVAQVPSGEQLVAEDVPSQLVHVALRQPVVQGLVVDGVEALAHELYACPPRVDLVVLVALRKGQEAGEALAHAREQQRPELGAGVVEPLLPEQGTPRPLDDGVAAEHGHVHADGVALLRDLQELLRDVLAALLGPIVELGGVSPVAGVGIASEERALAGLDEYARQCSPGTVTRHVVGHEVQHQAAAACGQTPAEGGEVGVAAQGRIEAVSTDGVRRADAVSLRKLAREAALEVPAPAGVGEVVLGTVGANLPAALQPDDVAPRRHGVELGVGNFGEAAHAECVCPRPGVQQKDGWVLRYAEALHGT